MFVEVLGPHSSFQPASLALACTALVAAGDALTSAVTRGNCSASEAEEAFSILIGAVAECKV